VIGSWKPCISQLLGFRDALYGFSQHGIEFGWTHLSVLSHQVHIQLFPGGPNGEEMLLHCPLRNPRVAFSQTPYLLRRVCIHNSEPESGGKMGLNYVYILDGVGTHSTRLYLRSNGNGPVAALAYSVG